MKRFVTVDGKPHVSNKRNVVGFQRTHKSRPMTLRRLQTGTRLAASANVPDFLRIDSMAEKSKLSINAAVMTCLARCTGSEAPLACVGEFLDELSGLGWQNSDIEQVASAVLQLLSRSGVTGNVATTVAAAGGN